MRASGGQQPKVIDQPVAVVIVNYRTPELTARCVSALLEERREFKDLQVVVVDGGSGDGSAEALAAWISKHDVGDWVELLALPVNGGFGWANNRGIQRLASRSQPPAYIHLLNPDSEIQSGAARLLADYLNAHPHAAAVGSQLINPDGSSAGSAFNFPSIRGELSRGARTAALDRLFKVPPISIEASEPVEVDWVTGGSVMFRVEALREVGLFDEGFFLYNEEIELMWRLRAAGWAIAIEPRSRVRHIGGAATGVHDREKGGSVEPRRPAYLYRSRARFFGLTRGRLVSALAFTAFLLGHVIWKARRLLRISSGKPIDHEFRDHVRIGFPRHSDFVPAIARIGAEPADVPAWMHRKWL
jgi:GT2 family glycosyltransferase